MTILNPNSSYLKNITHFFARFYFLFIFIQSDSKRNSRSIDIPDKYYNASLEILSQAFAYQNQGEWTKEDAC